MDINNLSNRTVFRILLMVAAFIGLGWLGIRLHRELVWLATAFFLALALNPAVEAVAKFMPKRKRGLAVGFVFLVAIGLIAFLVARLAPLFVSQTEGLVRSLPTLADRLESSGGFIGKLARNHQGFIRSEQTQLASKLTSLSLPIAAIARSVVNSIIATLTVLVLTFFMLLEGPKRLAEFWKLHPDNRRRHRQKLAEDMYRAVSGYVTGNLLASLIAAVATAIALTAVGMHFAIPLAIIVGVFDLIPLIGHPIAAVVVAALTLPYAGSTATVVMLGFFVVYSQLENHLLRPIVYSRTVKMSPLLVLIAVILGTALAGLLGAIVAIPAAASLQILGKDYFVRHPRA